MKKNTVILTAVTLLVLVLLWSWSARQVHNTASPGVSDFREYRLDDQPATVKLPPTTRVEAETPGNDEMLFSAYLRDEQLHFRGYLQLWNITDLEKFLAASKEYSRFDFKGFKQRPINLRTCRGYQVDWTATLQNSQTVAGREYFLKRDSGYQVLRISLFTARTGLPKELELVAENMVASVKWSK